MDTWITSDVHRGARQCRAEWFDAFLAHVPPSVCLVLNGDVITRRTRGETRLPPVHAAVLDRIRSLSLRQKVIWLGGNHDRRVRVRGKHRIVFVREYAIGKHLFVAHGDRFDHLSHSLRFALLPVRLLLLPLV